MLRRNHRNLHRRAGRLFLDLYLNRYIIGFSNAFERLVGNWYRASVTGKVDLLDMKGGLIFKQGNELGRRVGSIQIIQTFLQRIDLVC